MFEEIPYKFQYMLNKILNCIIEYIIKNRKNSTMIESKLLLINNYILDIFHTPEISRNGFMNRKFQQMLNSSTFSDKTVSPEHDKNITLSKFTNIFFNIMQKGKDDSKEQIKTPISPYRDKNKIIKLKKLLKNEQEKSMIKELSYLKKLSFVQEKLNYYESKRNNIEKKRRNNNNNSKESKSISFLQLKAEKNLRARISKNLINNLSYLTVINSCKNKKLNFFQNNVFPNTSRIIKHPVNQNKIDDKEVKKQNLNNQNSKINLSKEKKLLELIKDKNNFINNQNV